MQQKATKAIDVNSALTQENLQFYNVLLSPFKLYGLFYSKDEDCFRRMPREIANATSESVVSLSKNTAGGRLKFATNSKFIALNVKMPSYCNFAHMPLSGTSGFDLYVDGRYSHTYVPSLEFNGGYEGLLTFDDEKMRDITLNFPLYAPVSSVYIGLDGNSNLRSGSEYINEKPILFYGSSITQGGCASRPGLSYQNIISTDYNLDYINLGFSGSAKAEPAMVEYLSSLDASMFVCDYDHNAPTLEYLSQTHENLIKTYRKKQPKVPIILISKPDFDSMPCLSNKRRSVIFNTYINAVNSGDENIYFIDGEQLFGCERRDLCTVDKCHPNDLGFYRMAKTIGSKIAKIFKLKEC